MEAMESKPVACEAGYRFCTLYSGSTGNAAYLETPHTRLLIDAGKCTRTLLASLSSIGVAIDTVDAILVTHEHSDHVASLEVLAKKHPIPVHILYESALRYSKNPPEALCGVLQIYRAAPFTVTVGDVSIRAFPTPHDSRASVGYRFEFPVADRLVRLGFATDIGYVTKEIREGLAGCEAVILESNHDPEMLMNGPYPYDLKLRIRSRRGHLCNRDCAELCAELAEEGTTHFLLAHLSETNNLPELAYDEVHSTLGGGFEVLRVASPDRVTMLVGEADAPIDKCPSARETLSTHMESEVTRV